MFVESVTPEKKHELLTQNVFLPICIYIVVCGILSFLTVILYLEVTQQAVNVLSIFRGYKLVI